MPVTDRRPADRLVSLDDPRARALLKVWEEATAGATSPLGWSLQARLRGRRVLSRRGQGCGFDPFSEALAQLQAVQWECVHLEFDVARLAVIRRAEDVRLLPHDEALGLMSLRLRVGAHSKAWSPSSMLADNCGFMRRARAALGALGIPPALFWRLGGTLETFAARSFVLLAGSRDATEVTRGHRSRIDDPIDEGELHQMAAGLHGWMLRNTDATGRTTYRVHGADGSLPAKNNAIRQFMATIVLHRTARRGLGGSAAFETARRSLAYNLAAFYREHAGVGIALYGGKAKLGAAALAALAILEQEGIDGVHADQLRMLTAGIERLWQTDGAFRTFHLPPERNDNQNFYPGEALLFLAHLNAVSPDPIRRDRILASLAWYRDWHAADPNPAFVPWHTRAAMEMYRQTGAAFLADHIFAMNDWLLAMLQDEVPYPDLRGRFYDPAHPDYGPPHVASTAVFLEGLLAAAELARQCGDRAREDRYRCAIDAGLRSLRELQFRDPLDLALVRTPERFAGALRTNPFNSDVRVDNVQHALEAVLQAIDAPALVPMCERPAQAA